MPVAFRSATTSTYASRTNNVLAAPAGIVNDDALLLIVAMGTGTEAVDPTAPAGFTLLTGFPTDLTAGSFNVELRAWVKVASSESGSYTVTHAVSSSQAYLGAYSGVDTLTPVAPNPNVTTGTGVAASALGGLHTTRAGSLIVYAHHNWGSTANNLTAPTVSPVTLTERLDTGIMYVADGVPVYQTATGPMTMNTNSAAAEPWAVALIALQPPNPGDVTSYSPGRLLRPMRRP